MSAMPSVRTVLVAVDAPASAAAVVTDHGGERLADDRLAAAFDSSADALRAAAALVALGSELRAGVDAGEPSVALEVAERVCEAAEPGQVLITEAVAHLAGIDGAGMLAPAGGLRVPELRRTVTLLSVGQQTLEAQDVITVVIADDQALLRTGFRVIVDAEPDLRVVGEAADGRGAIDVVRRRRPDVVLMDIRMPVLDGLEAAEAILGDPDLDTAVVMLTTFDSTSYVYDALRIGASGFLLKDAPADRLLDAIRVVAAGEALLAPAITRRLVERFASAARVPDDGIPAQLGELTPRELEVLRLIGRGKSNGEIAAELVLGENTIKTHVGRVFAKLGLRDRAQAVVVAYESGLLVPEA